ncbi:hypothetical protein G5I_05270 [Acromyrmex echinatior]|uniref:Uncharacterized protein n=1 Tax=Acromyrmex echinatior TaxID=103372 RepID=F4WI01_ACREC|nr:hypothetical protein G5I_05270 [Acromyrmex echinatior]
MYTEVKTKRDATGARDPKSAKRHGVARELKMGDSWANGLPKIQRTWRKSGRVKSVDVNVNPTRNSICISAEDTVGLNRMGSFSVEAYNNPLVQWVELKGTFGVCEKEGRKRWRKNRRSDQRVENGTMKKMK